MAFIISKALVFNYVLLWFCANECGCLQRSEMPDPLGDSVTLSCDLIDLSVENRTPIVICAFNC